MTTINLCDYCGRETTAGKNLAFRSVQFSPRLTKRWKATGHDDWRFARVEVRFGVDGCSPEGEHPGHDICNKCQMALVRTVLEGMEATS